jgi:hypothetical protein
MISQRRTTAGRGWALLVSWIVILVLGHFSSARGPATADNELRSPAGISLVSTSGLFAPATVRPFPLASDLPGLPDIPDLPAELDEVGREQIVDTAYTPRLAAISTSPIVRQLTPCAGARTTTRQPSASWTTCVVRDFRGPPSA